MRLLSYGLDYRMEPRLAFSLRGQVIDVMRASLWMKDDRGAHEYLKLASTMKLALEDWPRSYSLLSQLEEAFQSIEPTGLKTHDRRVAMSEEDVVFFAPIPDPPSIRFFNAFNDVPVEHYDFGQTQTLRGHGQDVQLNTLSPRGELAVILSASKTGEQAGIAGYCVVNNWTATQEKASGKTGFALGQATSMGPYLVTADQVEPLQIGKGFNMDMQISVDGRIEVDSRLREMKFSFQEMLETSRDTHVAAGDILCSGSPSKRDLQLTAGQTLDIEIQSLGTLTTRLI